MPKILETFIAGDRITLTKMHETHDSFPIKSGTNGVIVKKITRTTIPCQHGKTHRVYYEANFNGFLRTVCTCEIKHYAQMEKRTHATRKR